MIAGDIGSILDAEQVGYDTSFGFYAVRLGSTNNFVISHGGSAHLKTFNVDPTTGAIIVIDLYSKVGYGSSSGGYIIHISGTVYAVWIAGADDGGGIFTINISDDGTIGSEIAQSNDIASDGFARGNMLEVYDTGSSKIIAASYYDSTCFLRTYIVSYDGTFIGLIDTETIYSNGNYTVMAEIYDNYFVIFSGSISYNALVSTVNISNAGVISIVDSLDLCGSINTGIASIAKVVEGIFAFFYLNGSVGNIIIKTIAISNSGVIGSVLDTDTTLLAGSSINTIDNRGVIPSIGSSIFLLPYSYNSVGCKVSTVSINSSGIIGSSLIDTLIVKTDGLPQQCFKIDTDLYGLIYRYSNNPFLATFNVEDGVVIGSTTGRVGSIRHIYRPGVYKAEITLGGLSAGIDTPDLYVPGGKLSNPYPKAEDQIPEATITPNPKPIEPTVAVTPSIIERAMAPMQGPYHDINVPLSVYRNMQEAMIADQQMNQAKTKPELFWATITFPIRNLWNKLFGGK